MSEAYIKRRFADIKNFANIIETRLDDEGCTLESVLEDNAKTFRLAQQHNVNHVLIDDDYEILVEL